MSEKPPSPALPLEAREYAYFTRAQARRSLAGPLRRGAWGLLLCVDALGAHWTAFGDFEFVRALKAAETPRKTPDGYNLGPYADRASHRGVTAKLMGEFPLDEFRPEWLLNGWPDEWPLPTGAQPGSALRKLYLQPFASERS